jgi:hypothetical protein
VRLSHVAAAHTRLTFGSPTSSHLFLTIPILLLAWVPSLSVRISRVSDEMPKKKKTSKCGGRTTPFSRR